MDRPYRLLPSVDEALRDARVAQLEPRVGRALLRELVQAALEGWRGEIAAERLDGAGLEQRLAHGALADVVARGVEREQGRGLVRAVNATGVVLHTGLGRAPLHPEAAARMAAVAAGYCVLEVDRESAARSRRDARAAELLGRLVGAPAAICVNNNAGAVLLVLSTFAHGQRREVVVSRGELVEIGGSFRVPDVMERAGARLVEVGTTNRTRIGDYARAIGPETGLLMKVHTSNFKLVGFTSEVAPDEIARLGAERGITTAWDLGSGLIEGEQHEPLTGLEGETRVADALASGVDVVTFSGDKLLGAPQAGILVGSPAAIEALRANPMYRALRLDKAALAGLEATLELYLAGRANELPARAMLRLAADELDARARALAAQLVGIEGLDVSVVASTSEPGSGSAPGVELATSAVRLGHARLSPDGLARALRAGNPPVFARIHEGALLLDPRTLLPGDEGLVAQSLRAIPRQ